MRSRFAKLVFCLAGLSLVLGALVAIPAMRSAEAASATIRSTTTGNVFTSGETPAFKLLADGEARWAVRDFWGNPVTEGTTTVEESTELEVPVEENGYYVLRVTTGYGEQERHEQVAFAMLPEPAEPRNDGFTYGMQTHFSHGWNPKVVPLLSKIGVEAVRDQQSWEEIETSRGTYDFQAMDGRYQEYMDALKAEDINVLAQFGLANANYDNGATPYTEEGRRAYGRFVRAVLDHYGDQISEVSVYNEPNLPKFGDFGDGPADATPENYKALLEQTYRVVNEVRPEVKVAGPEVAAGFSNEGKWNPWLEEFFALGGLEHLDSMSVHPYRDRCCPPEGIGENLEAVRDLMSEHGAGDKPIWITEQGWTTDLVPDRKQARYLLRSYVLAQKEATRFNWYNFMDHRKTYGLIREKSSDLGRYSPKPSYVSYGVMTDQLAGLEYQGIDSPPEGVRSVRFGGNGTTRVMWAPTDHKTVALHTNSPVEVTDMMGASHDLMPVDGKVVLRLTGDPMYVDGEVDGIELDDRFSLDAEKSAASDEIPAMVSLRGDGGVSTLARFEVDDQDYHLTALPGEVDQERISVASGGGSGRRVVQAKVYVAGMLNGLLSKHVRLQDDVKVRMIPQVPDASGEATSMNVEVTNNRRSADYHVSQVDWKMDGEQGSTNVDVTVAPKSSQEIPVQLPDRGYWRQYDASTTVHFDGEAPLGNFGELGFNPAYQIGASADSDQTQLDLDRLGVVQRTDAGIPYGGPSDLGGTMWFTADETNFYVSAKVSDDTHFNDQTGRGIKTGDSVHIGLARGMPGDTKEFYQYASALTPDGPKARRIIAPPGEDTGPLDSEVSVSRDEANATTTYRFAIPWDELEQIDYEDSVFSLSAMVVDNDGDDAVDREGWIQWGSGLGAGKDPSLFRPVAIAGR